MPRDIARLFRLILALGSAIPAPDYHCQSNS